MILSVMKDVPEHQDMKCHLSFLRIKLSSDDPNARAVLEFLHTQYNLFYSWFLYSIVFLRETDYLTSVVWLP